MPLYEYECRKCHHRFEEIQKFSDPPIKKCPKCRSGKVVKLLSAPAVHFKGSGWYVTDYGGKGSSDKTGKKDRGDKADKSDKGEKGEKGDKPAGESKTDTGGKSSGKD